MNVVLGCGQVRCSFSHRLNQHPILNDRYLLLEMIGKGGFSEVFKVSKSICDRNRVTLIDPYSVDFILASFCRILSFLLLEFYPASKYSKLTIKTLEWCPVILSLYFSSGKNAAQFRISNSSLFGSAWRRLYLVCTLRQKI